VRTLEAQLSALIKDLDEHPTSVASMEALIDLWFKNRTVIKFAVIETETAVKSDVLVVKEYLDI